MKHSIHCTVFACVLAALVIGCASTRSTENIMLSAAGFTAVPATTPQQQAHLHSLAPDEITSVVRNGTTYYVYADPNNQMFYVGRDAQYQQYQKLRLENQIAEEQLKAVETGPAWGEWAPLGFWSPQLEPSD